MVHGDTPEGGMMWDNLYEAIYQACVNSNPNSEYTDQMSPERFEEILSDLGYKVVEITDE